VAVIDLSEDTERLELLDRYRRQLAPSALLDRGLAQPRTRALRTGGQACRLAREGVRVDRKVDAAHATRLRARV